MAAVIRNTIRMRDKISQLIKSGNFEFSYSDFAAHGHFMQKETKKAKSKLFQA